ncbi:hypothetical protein Ddye_028664 [Dipteronia dyeriana]|uniref:Uncharacterized protein n=1 Tax=Dipteronia dyeriana TaxID=168575 RepID=A0AAD9WKR2_9ROSI|nr:hypothetical protein Ddye_028664 [Dipteronia dyeriana]
MHSDSEVATIEQSQLARAMFSDSEVARFEIQMLNQPTVGVRRSKKCASHGKRSKAPREGTRDAGSPSKPSQPTCVELRMRDSNSVSQGRLPKPKTFRMNEPTCGQLQHTQCPRNEDLVSEQVGSKQQGSELVTRQSQLARVMHSDSEVATIEQSQLARAMFSDSEVARFEIQMLNQPTVGVRRSKKCASHGKRSKAPREGTRDAGSPSKPSQPTCVELRMRDSNSVSQGRLPKPKTFRMNEPTCGQLQHTQCPRNEDVTNLSGGGCHGPQAYKPRSPT